MQAKISVLGHFGEGVNLLNGQTVKTKIITDELQNQFGKENVLIIDTHGGFKTLLKAPFQVFSALRNSRNVLIFPAQNGLRVYAPLLFLFRMLFKGRKLHYAVIGGWLPKFLPERKFLAKSLKHFDGIYAETKTMKSALNEQGFKNVYVMPNCKKLNMLAENDLIYPEGVPFRLCTFSRVMKEKGIETAVTVIKQVNEKLGYTAFTLDIYGQIDAQQTQWFENLKTAFPDYIRYLGSIDSDKSVGVLKNYFALIFPTHFYTEGIPGTIIDAYSAGIPVISAKWESFSDVVDEGLTGIGYEFDNEKCFEEILLNAAKNPQAVLDMKKNCIIKAKNYTPGTATEIMIENFE